jgi:hypothetical protein
MEILARIRELEADLYAEIVMQGVGGHYEYRGIGSPVFWEGETVFVANTISFPDEEKRKGAKEELERIYREAKWYQFIRKIRIEGIPNLNLTNNTADRKEREASRRYKEKYGYEEEVE